MTYKNLVNRQIDCCRLQASHDAYEITKISLRNHCMSVTYLKELLRQKVS